MIKLPYKKLKIWEKGISLVKKIYELTKTFPKEEIYGLTSQMRRSAVSIPSNIAEGSQRISDKEFSNFILIAKGSLAELQTQLIIAEGFKYIEKNNFEKIIIETEELDSMLLGFYKKLTAYRFPLSARN